ncbi:MAG: T9SS type A sorting domain-containing protein [Saprospiraceae bacterium]|nr:T9SS type A sorting domain-containing protein [Saprospiraceae bacterium]
MKSLNTLWNSARLLIAVLFCVVVIGCINAQNCSVDAITAKYWQYRQNLNKHFVLNDIDSSGCIGDGIGLSSTPEDCTFSKSGYGLPATSIIISYDGGSGMFDRNGDTSSVWYDAGCAEAGPDSGTHHSSIPNRKFNHLEYGSETPHQMGYYWGTLATEYALLTQNHQYEAAQKTLDELFLGLQAYRRLDMQANCQVKKRYDEIKAGFEVGNECISTYPWNIFEPERSCLCIGKYVAGTNHPTFSTPCSAGCSYTADLSGYSGFFLREDAVQEQELLHDPTEERWNIDLVSSAFAMSVAPPCTTSFSQPCYLVKWQNFMSQDGVIGLMIGLTLIKKFIPASAMVTTCDSTVYYPLEMAIDISSAIVDRVDRAYRNWILWPESGNCCERKVYLTESEGGSMKFTIHGLKKAANYMDGGSRHSNSDEYLHWQYLTAQAGFSESDNGKFWLRLMALGWDVGDKGSVVQNIFKNKSEIHGTEILGMINNILYPGGGDVKVDRDFFEAMLCSAPCSGPCVKQPNYGTNGVLPEFPCSNTPDWRGQRWESGSVNPELVKNRLYNGLDYMLLYNIYMLHFPVQQAAPYQNPDYATHPNANSFFGDDHILGSSTLCKGSTGYYEIDPVYDVIAPSTTATVLTDIKWSSTSSLLLESEQMVGTDVTMEGDDNPSYLEVSFTQQRDINLFNSNGTPVIANYVEQIPPQSQTPDIGCHFTFRKQITNASELNVNFSVRYSECSGTVYAVTDNLELEGLEYNWNVVNMETNAVTFYQGPQISIPVSSASGASGTLFIQLTIENELCPDEDGITQFNIFSWDCNAYGYKLAIQPNPADNEIAITITKDGEIENINEEKGLIINRTNGNMSPIVSTLYTNGQSINVSNLPNGTYSIEVLDEKYEKPLSATFIINR